MREECNDVAENILTGIAVLYDRDATGSAHRKAAKSTRATPEMRKQNLHDALVVSGCEGGVRLVMANGGLARSSSLASAGCSADRPLRLGPSTEALEECWPAPLLEWPPDERSPLRSAQQAACRSASCLPMGISFWKDRVRFRDGEIGLASDGGASTARREY
ncbi:hypothetical protein BD289DRAFT_261539 [Coniella lustricola]|uniref:Uncharacterized protein n=1 Tax=Coniella lustricola TaxID=2025994 RepID=A0A2T3A7S6_9PEZI|nr:hypothetical protein BD289DRAFT_261539 [Coniella lustricola]